MAATTTTTWSWKRIEKGDSNSQGHRFGAEIDPAFRGGMFRRKIGPKPPIVLPHDRQGQDDDIAKKADAGTKDQNQGK